MTPVKFYCISYHDLTTLNIELTYKNCSKHKRITGFFSTIHHKIVMKSTDFTVNCQTFQLKYNIISSICWQWTILYDPPRIDEVLWCQRTIILSFNYAICCSFSLWFKHLFVSTLWLLFFVIHTANIMFSWIWINQKNKLFNN